MNAIKNYHFKNWAESYTCSPNTFYEPSSEEELKEILEEARNLNKKVRIVGNGHSPSDLCCTNDFMVSMKKCDKILQIDKANCTVTVQGGIILGKLIDKLKKENLALLSMPDIMDLTVAGMISTATHMSGIEYSITSHYVTSMTLMKSDGTKVYCSPDENSEIYYAAGVGLGCIGIILQVTIQCSPLYHLEMVQTSESFDYVLKNVKELATSSQYTRMFYVPYTDRVTVHRINRSPVKPKQNPYSWFWDLLIGFIVLQALYFLSLYYQPMVKLINVVYQKLFYENWFVIHDSYENIFTFDIKFRQYVSEWAIPIDRTPEALIKLRHAIETSKFPAHIPIEIRFVKSDNFYLSPAYGRDSAFINIIAYRPYGVEPNHKMYWSTFADIMVSLNARPHLAKDHPLTSATMKLILPKFHQFCSVRKTMDPNKVFVNDYIERVLGS